MNYAQYHIYYPKRFNWIKSSMIANWYSQLIVGRDTKQMHIILETDRWNEKLIGKCKLTLEILTSKSDEWKKIGDFSTIIHDSMYEWTSGIILITPQDSKREEFDNLRGITERFFELKKEKYYEKANKRKTPV